MDGDGRMGRLIAWIALAFVCFMILKRQLGVQRNKLNTYKQFHHFKRGYIDQAQIRNAQIWDDDEAQQ